MISASPWFCWILLIVATQGGSGHPNDGGHLSIVSTQKKSNVMTENNTLSIVMNSTAFLDAVGSRIQEILRNQPSSFGLMGCERSCKKKRFEITTSHSLSWHDALIFCKERRMNLATIRNQEDNDAILEKLKELGMANGEISRMFWIGGTILHSLRGWFWIADGEKVTYTNWLAGQPDDYGNAQKCMTYQHGWNNDIRWAWDDNYCGSALSFACEYC